MNAYRFDDRAIAWTRFGDFEPRFDYMILNIDEDLRIADVLFRLPAGEKIVLHRHLALNHSFVVQGHHRLYDLDGVLTEDRPTGRYTVIAASEKPHREGGGDEDAIVLFSIRPGAADELYELLDEALNPIAVVTFSMLIELYRARNAMAA